MDKSVDFSNGRVTFEKWAPVYWICNECGTDFSDGTDDDERDSHDCNGLEFKAEKVQERLRFLSYQDWRYRQIDSWLRIVVTSVVMGFITTSFIVVFMLQIDSVDGEIDSDEADQINVFAYGISLPLFSVLTFVFMAHDRKSARRKISNGSLRQKSGRWWDNLSAEEIDYLKEKGKVRF